MKKCTFILCGYFPITPYLNILLPNTLSVMKAKKASFYQRAQGLILIPSKLFWPDCLDFRLSSEISKFNWTGLFKMCHLRSDMTNKHLLKMENKL